MPDLVTTSVGELGRAAAPDAAPTGAEPEAEVLAMAGPDLPQEQSKTKPSTGTNE